MIHSGKLEVEGTSWRKLFTHSLFAESVCLLENDNQPIENFIKKRQTSNNVNHNYYNESQITMMNNETACLIGYREGK